jgi:hypothetical protein
MEEKMFESRMKQEDAEETASTIVLWFFITFVLVGLISALL